MAYEIEIFNSYNNITHKRKIKLNVT